MPLILILLAALLIVSSVRDTQGDLFGALKEDVPAFGVWAAALIGLGLIGYIPGLKIVSRGLIALIVIVLVVNNAPKIVTGFENAWKPKGEAA